MNKTTYGLAAVVWLAAVACGGRPGGMADSAEHDHPAGKEQAEHQPAGEHGHDNGGGQQQHHTTMMGGAFSWKPAPESMDLLAYKTHNIKLARSGEEDVLMFEPAGSKASCMFNSKHGNVGVSATVKLMTPEAEVKLLHHSQDQDNYEFVAVKGSKMILGRVENGEEKILDSKEVEVPDDWFELTVTAAGSHFKGYLNGKMITHGHADEREPGLLGIVVSGNGQVLVKEIEATPLEAEH